MMLTFYSDNIPNNVETLFKMNTHFFQLSDDEEDIKRVVRSAREKRYEDLNKIIKNIRNSKKIKDFTKMESGFLELVKAYEKAKPVVEKEENGVTPRFFVRVLVELEEVVNEQWEDRDGRKKMSKSNAKSLGSLRQKHRKYIKDFEEDVKKFTENPDAADDEDEKEMSKDQVIFFQITRNGILLPKLFCEKKLF